MAHSHTNTHIHTHRHTYTHITGPIQVIQKQNHSTLNCLLHANYQIDCFVNNLVTVLLSLCYQVYIRKHVYI